MGLEPTTCCVGRVGACLRFACYFVGGETWQLPSWSQPPNVWVKAVRSRAIWIRASLGLGIESETRGSPASSAPSIVGQALMPLMRYWKLVGSSRPMFGPVTAISVRPVLASIEM